jgi:hypothetical protein
VGFGKLGVRRGGITCSHAVYRCDQNAVPHAEFSSARVPYLRRSHDRNADADVSHQHREM